MIQKLLPNVFRYKYKLKLYVTIILLLVWGGPTAYSDSGKVRYHVIIDTDTAVDDLRSICLFLASPEFEILAITTSDGVLGPKQGLVKIKSLLRSFGHDGIPTGAGQEILDNPPSWRNFNRKVPWGAEENSEIKNENSAADIILSALKFEEKPVLLVCLGGLTNLAEALKKDHQIHRKIEKIVWYCDNFTQLAGTNYLFDENAAQTVFSSPIALEAVSNMGADNSAFNLEFLQSLQALDSPYAKKITSTHFNNEIIKRIKTGHLEFWDDLIPIYLLYPELFASRKSEKNDLHKSIQMRGCDKIKIKYREILHSRNKVESEVFKGFPEDPELFADDVRPYMERIIQKHGKEEWRLGVLTNELHGHLGIFAIIGAKMGLRARQHFHIGVDDIAIISYAGSTPPLSCMNDGLQVSTGGTVGHGLMTVNSDPPFQPKAVFTFKNRTVRFRLKDQYWNIIKNDVAQGIELHGKNTKGYWEYIRQLALDYWLKWNRREIFTSEVISLSLF